MRRRSERAVDRERPIVLDEGEVQELALGRLVTLYKPVDIMNLRVELKRPVSSEPLLLELRVGKTVEAGVYLASLNPQGAVSIGMGEAAFGLKPGEFDFLCPYIHLGETDLRDAHLGGYGPTKVWTVTPRVPQVLWEREPWAVGKCADVFAPKALDPGTWLRDNGGCWYDNAAPPKPISPQGRWRSALHMPRWAARRFVEASLVRIQKDTRRPDVWVWAIQCRRPA